MQSKKVECGKEMGCKVGLFFQVMGSGDNVYDIDVEVAEKNLTITCTCRAGQNRQYCKHRFALMNGDISALLSDNSKDVETLGEWLKGSDVERQMQAVQALEEEAAGVKKRLQQAKKKLAQAMHD